MAPFCAEILMLHRHQLKQTQDNETTGTHEHLLMKSCFQTLHNSFCRNYTKLAMLPIKVYLKQECIPRGCVPSASVAVSGGGGGGSGCLPEGGCLHEEVSA